MGRTIHVGISLILIKSSNADIRISSEIVPPKVQYSTHNNVTKGFMSRQLFFLRSLILKKFMNFWLIYFELDKYINR